MQELNYKGSSYGYNFSMKYKDLPNQVKDMIINCRYRHNDNCYHNPVVYFTIERDYFIKVSCMYYDRDNESLNFIDLPVEIYNSGKDIFCNYRFDNDKDTQFVIDWFKGQFKNCFYIAKDYDYEQVMEAIELGDYDLVDDIVGDRDLMEII